MSYLLAFAGFAALIILHEAGHFVAAKAVGMRVERFALFFPPLVARWRPKNSETEYGIGAIPLGGYVKITGMNPDEVIAPAVAHRAYFRQPVWKRVVVIAAGPVVNIVLAFLILWVLFLSQGKPVPGVGVLQTQSPPASQVLQENDLILSVDGVSGYAPGLDGKAIDARAAALRKAIGSHACAPPRVNGCRAATPAQMVISRDGRTLTVAITPRYDAVAKRMLVGFVFGVHQALDAAGAASYSLAWMWDITTTSAEGIVKIFYDSKARDDVSGIVGSYEATRQSFEFDTTRAILLLGFISLSLAVINLFPFLPLDGGHIFWAVAEKLRGRAIPVRLMERASIVGFMLVLFVFYVGLSNDIGRLSSGEGFGVR